MKHLQLTANPLKLGKIVMRNANYMLTLAEFDIFYSRLESLKVPSDYCLNMKNYVH